MNVGSIIKDDALGKLHKNVAIAKSGIYQYHRMELNGLFGETLKVPEQHTTRSVFNVFRPPEVLKDAKDLFVQLPLTREHPEDFVTTENIRDKKIDWIGWTGDSSKVEILEVEGDITINSTLNIVDRIGVHAYDSGVREVSPGYVADFIWKDGIDKNGTQYQIVMTKITEVNHLALVDNGRGGKDASILDSKKSLFKENDMDENVVMKALRKMFGKTERILDSMPKNIDEFTPEQTKYLLKETHRLLTHKASGKSFDSFYPIGYTKDDDDMIEKKEEVADEFPIEEKKEDKKDEVADEFPVEEKKDDKKEEKKDEVADEFPIEEKKDEVEDAPAEQTAFAAEKVIEPVKVKSTEQETSVTPQEPIRAKDSTFSVQMDSRKVVDKGVDPFSIMDQIRSGFSVKKETK